MHVCPLSVCVFVCITGGGAMVTWMIVGRAQWSDSTSAGRAADDLASELHQSHHQHAPAAS